MSPGSSLRLVVAGLVATSACAVGEEGDGDGAGETATGAALDGRRTGSDDWEAEGFSRERGISFAEARRRLAWQVRAPRLGDRVAVDLGDRFGGIWIDVLDGDRIKVGIAGRASGDKIGAVRRAADAVGLSEGYDLIEVRHALAALERANDWLAAEIERVNAGAPATLTAGLRADLNALRLEAPDEGELTADQRELIAAARARFGDMIEVGSYAGRPTARACLYPHCDAPLRGGVRISHPTAICTGAFIARTSGGALRQFTAGHCTRGRTGDWSTSTASNTLRAIGPATATLFSSEGDVAVLGITDAAGWSPQPWVLVTSGPDTTYDTTYDINTDGSSVLGMRICTTGGSYGRSDCGYVTALGVTATYGGVTVRKLGRASFCGVGGDSGAPMYARQVAYGIHVAGYSECDSLYQGIQGAESLLNVNVVHAP